MNYVLAGLSVYKLMQLLNSLTPREAMPWVKVSVGIVLGYIMGALFSLPHAWTSGLVVATLASACHGVLRLVTLLGDYAERKSLK